MWYIDHVTNTWAVYVHTMFQPACPMACSNSLRINAAWRQNDTFWHKAMLKVCIYLSTLGPGQAHQCNEVAQTNRCFPRHMLSICGHDTFHRDSEGKGQTSRLRLASGSNNPLDVPLRTWTLGDDSDSKWSPKLAAWILKITFLSCFVPQFWIHRHFKVGSIAQAPAAAARTSAWRMGDLRRRAEGIADAIALGHWWKQREADNGIRSINDS